MCRERMFRGFIRLNQSGFKGRGRWVGVRLGEEIGDKFGGML